MSTNEWQPTNDNVCEIIEVLRLYCQYKFNSNKTHETPIEKNHEILKS